MSLRFAGVALLGMVMGFGVGAASASEHVVKMVNDNGKGDFMAFEPTFVTAAAGDTVKFVVDALPLAAFACDLPPGQKGGTARPSRLQGSIQRPLPARAQGAGLGRVA